MRKLKKENIVSSVVIVILVVELIAVFINSIDYITSRLERLQYRVDWEELYPFEEQEANETVHSGIIDTYKNISSVIVSKCQLIANTYSICRNDVVELYGALNKALGVRIIKDSEIATVLLESGYLTYQQDRNDYIEQNIEDVISLNNYVREKGMQFLYVQAPAKKFSDKDIIPGCLENYSDKEKSLICKNLLLAGVDVFDVRTYMPIDYDAYMSWFYKTDHHWRVESGLYTTYLLADFLNINYDFQIDKKLFEEDSFTKQTYSECFLGSEGKKFTLGYVSAEDFNLLRPKEEQDWSVNIPKLGIQETGKFDIILDSAQLGMKDLYNESPYAAYSYGDQPYLSILNNKMELGKKVLIVGDSYSEVIVPFLALGCKQVDRIDLRLFNGSLRTFLNQHPYDVIILLECNAGEEYDVQMHNSMWDFN